MCVHSSACKQGAVHPGSTLTPASASPHACVVVLSWTCVKDWQIYGWTTDVTWTILTMSLLPFWALNVAVALLSMQGQKALKLRYFLWGLCFKDERRSYGLGTTWGWEINDMLFHFWVNYPFKKIFLGIWERYIMSNLTSVSKSIFTFFFYIYTLNVILISPHNKWQYVAM